MSARQSFFLLVFERLLKSLSEKQNTFEGGGDFHGFLVCQLVAATECSGSAVVADGGHINTEPAAGGDLDGRGGRVGGSLNIPTRSIESGIGGFLKKISLKVVLPYYPFFATALISSFLFSSEATLSFTLSVTLWGKYEFLVCYII